MKFWGIYEFLLVFFVFSFEIFFVNDRRILILCLTTVILDYFV